MNHVPNFNLLLLIPGSSRSSRASPTCSTSTRRRSGRGSRPPRPPSTSPSSSTPPGDSTGSSPSREPRWNTPFHFFFTQRDFGLLSIRPAVRWNCLACGRDLNWILVNFGCSMLYSWKDHVTAFHFGTLGPCWFLLISETAFLSRPFCYLNIHCDMLHLVETKKQWMSRSIASHSEITMGRRLLATTTTGITLL